MDDDRLAVWRDFLRAHVAVMDALADELQEARGLPLTWYDVLVNLNGQGGSLRMQELARSVLLSKSGLTRLVDRMEAAGLLRREQCPGDRRGTLAVLTAEGKETLRNAAPVHLQGVAEHFGRHVRDEELENLGAVLRRLVEVHERSGPPARCDDERSGPDV